VSAAVPYHARGAYDVIKRHLVQRIFKEIFISWMINTGTSLTFLPAKFHNFTISGLFFIHKNKRVQFFMKHGVESCIRAFDWYWNQWHKSCWHRVKTTQATITKSSPTDSPRTLVWAIKSSYRNSKGFTPSEGVKWEWGRKNSQFSANKSPYLRNGARYD